MFEHWGKTRQDPGPSPLLLSGQPRRHDALHVDLGAVDEIDDLWADHILPVIALIHDLVQRFALRLAFEATHPDVNAVVLLASVASSDHHAFAHLERDDLLFHAFEPGLHLTRSDHILSELVKRHHSAPGLVSQGLAQASAVARQSEQPKVKAP